MLKIDPATITTRPLEKKDKKNAVQWLLDKDVMEFCPWEIENTEEADDFFEKNMLNFPNWHHAICVHDEAVGAIAVKQLDKNDKCRAEMGYVVDRHYWRKGVATVAVKKAAEKVFAEIKEVERLEAQVDVRNQASQGVAKKAGFTEEGILRKYSLLKGELRDIIMFSLVRTDLTPSASTSTST